MTTGVRDEWSNVDVDGYELDMRVYRAWPASDDSFPSVIVVHEAFGLDDHIQDLTRRFAAEGYAAVAPDLFSLDEFGRGVRPDELMGAMKVRRSLPAERRGDPAAVEEALKELPKAEGDRLREIMAWSARRDVDALVAPLQKAVSWARDNEASTHAVGAVGYCFGGGMVLRLAFAGTDIQAAAPYYGQNPALEQAGRVRCPLLLMYGRKDPFIMPGVPALLSAVHEADLSYSLHIYEEAGHAFLNDTRSEAYHEESARDAWHQTTRFFARHLR